MVMLRTTKRLFHGKMAPVKSHMCVRIGSVLVRVVRATRLVTSRQDDHSDPACSAVASEFGVPQAGERGAVAETSATCFKAAAPTAGH